MLFRFGVCRIVWVFVVWEMEVMGVFVRGSDSIVWLCCG